MTTSFENAIKALEAARIVAALAWLREILKATPNLEGFTHVEVRRELSDGWENVFRDTMLIGGQPGRVRGPRTVPSFPDGASFNVLSETSERLVFSIEEVMAGGPVQLFDHRAVYISGRSHIVRPKPEAPTEITQKHINLADCNAASGGACAWIETPAGRELKYVAPFHNYSQSRSELVLEGNGYHLLKVWGRPYDQAALRGSEGVSEDGEEFKIYPLQEVDIPTEPGW